MKLSINKVNKVQIITFFTSTPGCHSLLLLWECFCRVFALSRVCAFKDRKKKSIALVNLQIYLLVFKEIIKSRDKICVSLIVNIGYANLLHSPSNCLNKKQTTQLNKNMVFHSHYIYYKSQE